MTILRVVFLFLPACAYGFIVKIRNFLYDKKIFKSKRYDIPIICVGNLTVGGTGKTPHTRLIINYLRGKQVAILSRGYKRSTKGFRLVEINSRFCDCGDEALLIKRNFPETIVAVCEERCEGVEKLLELFPNLDAIILDDGFQHRKLTPSISIILNNYYRMFQHDFYLPYGRLRDCKSTYKRADYIIFTKCPENLSESQKTQLIEQSKVLPNQKILFSSIRYKNLQNVYEKTVQIALSELKDYNILLVTGIAESRNLVDFLETKTALVKHLRFSDHHNFSTKDISNILSEYERLYNPKIVVITEKDAIKFAELYVHDEFKNHIFYIPIEIEIL